MLNSEPTPSRTQRARANSLQSQDCDLTTHPSATEPACRCGAKHVAVAGAGLDWPLSRHSSGGCLVALPRPPVPRTFAAGGFDDRQMRHVLCGRLGAITGGPMRRGSAPACAGGAGVLGLASVSYPLHTVATMRLPADDPLLRLRAAVKRKLQDKPVPPKAQKPTKPRGVFRRSRFCKVGCTKYEHACWKCRSYKRWRQHHGLVD